MNRRALGFAQALISERPSPELGERAADLDWLVGAWSAIVRDYHDDGSFSESEGEWWFSWVLEGRALQDVWIVPTRRSRGTPRTRYGTTIRILDEDGVTWRIAWINAATGKMNALAGRWEGDRIVLDGVDGDDPIRWSFNDIAPNSFTWRGEHQTEGGVWALGAEFILTRVSVVVDRALGGL